MDSGELDELVRALSHRTRRKILRLCAERFVLAGEVAAEIDLALASVSEHLKVLRKTGLVELERRGTKWLYRTDLARVDATLAELGGDLPTHREPRNNEENP